MLGRSPRARKEHRPDREGANRYRNRVVTVYQKLRSTLFPNALQCYSIYAIMSRKLYGFQNSKRKPTLGTKVL